MGEVFSCSRSTFIDELEYDKDTDTLTIRFSDGSSFDYLNVSPATFRNMCVAPSVGSFFHRHIKDRYAFEAS